MPVVVIMDNHCVAISKTSNNHHPQGSIHSYWTFSPSSDHPILYDLYLLGVCDRRPLPGDAPATPLPGTCFAPRLVRPAGYAPPPPPAPLAGPGDWTLRTPVEGPAGAPGDPRAGCLTCPAEPMGPRAFTGPRRESGEWPALRSRVEGTPV